MSDYNKGVCKGDMIPRVVAMARAAGVPVFADPVKGADYRRYAGCACITPNRLEAATATGMTIGTPQDGLEAARRLLQFGVDSAIVTLDRDGMAWADQSGDARLVAARPRQVCDITGAGDMVLATLGYALAAGADRGHGHRNRQHGGRAGGRAAGSRARHARRNPRGTRPRLERHRAQNPADRPGRSPRPAASPGGAADRDDQRLLRSAAPRPRRLLAGGAPPRRLPAGRTEQRPQRAGTQGSGPSHRRTNKAGPRCWPPWRASITW